MAVFTLESLVLRGVSVLADGKAVELCRGTSEATAWPSMVRISMRHPSLGYAQAEANSLATRVTRHDAKCDVDVAAFGAGRSRGRAGVLSRRNPAFTAGRTTPVGRSMPRGRKLSIHQCIGHLPTGRWQLRSETFSKLAASTRGKGAR